MAIHRGIQSALFYYLSCTPCADSRYRKRRKQEAAQSRAERLALDAEESNVYRHPGEPSSTNPHWHSEIELGPTFIRKGKKKAGTGDGQRELKAGRVSSNASNHASLTDFPHGSGTPARVDRSWNLRRVGRGDEPWCGSESVLSEANHETSIQRPVTARTAGSTSTMYHMNYNPAINEMHPPTVTKVSRREDVVWMMQPVPTAGAMSARDRLIRSRSDSSAGRLNPSSTNMSRQVSTGMDEPRLRAGTPSAAGMSRENSFRSSVAPSGQRHDRISDHDFVPSTAQSSDSADESAGTVLRRPEVAVVRHPPQAVSRPRLSTVLSDGDLSYQSRQFSPKENSTPKSYHGVNRTLEDQAVRTAIATSDKPIGAVFRHRHDDSEASIPELFDSWYTPEFELGKYIFEHTKREVHKRWSMDL